MKKRYKRKAYYFDDGILLYGHKDKYGFHPERSLQCGFSRQILNKKDIGRVLFYSLSDAIYKLGDIEIAGGKFLFSIDNGLSVTKIMYAIDHVRNDYITTTLIRDNNVEPVIRECLKAAKITGLHSVKIKYILSSEIPRGVLIPDIQTFAHVITL